MLNHRMAKICIFVEGNSEAIFVEKIARTLLSGRNATIVSYVLSGGRRYPRMEMQRREAVLGSGADVYIQIVNSANEDRAISDARDQAQGLLDANFEQIVVVRDVAPNFKRSEIGRLRSGLSASLNELPLPATALLQIMEFEAWILSMADQYDRIDARLTEEAIIDEIGFLPCHTNCQEIDRPSDVHRRILALADIDEIKSRETVTCVVESLDLSQLVEDCVSEISDLEHLVQLISAAAA